jgi:hypothetical protein
MSRWMEDPSLACQSLVFQKSHRDLEDGHRLAVFLLKLDKQESGSSRRRMERNKGNKIFQGGFLEVPHSKNSQNDMVGK